MTAKKKRRSAASLELIWRTLTQGVDGAYSVPGTTENLVAIEYPPSASTLSSKRSRRRIAADPAEQSRSSPLPNKGRHAISLEFNVAMDAKAAAANAGSGLPLRIVASKSDRDRDAAATLIKLTVSYEPWCTVNVIV